MVESSIDTKSEEFGGVTYHNKGRVSIPKEIAKRVGLTEGGPVIINTDGKSLIITPISREKLNELLSR